MDSGYYVLAVLLFKMPSVFGYNLLHFEDLRNECFWITAENNTNTEARTTCEADGGQLVAIETQSTMNSVTSLLTNEGLHLDKIYIGSHINYTKFADTRSNIYCLVIQNSTISYSHCASLLRSICWKIGIVAASSNTDTVTLQSNTITDIPTSSSELLLWNLIDSSVIVETLSNNIPTTSLVETVQTFPVTETTTVETDTDLKMASSSSESSYIDDTTATAYTLTASVLKPSLVETVAAFSSTETTPEMSDTNIKIAVLSSESSYYTTGISELFSSYVQPLMRPVENTSAFSFESTFVGSTEIISSSEYTSPMSPETLKATETTLVTSSDITSSATTSFISTAGAPIECELCLSRCLNPSNQLTMNMTDALNSKIEALKKEIEVEISSLSSTVRKKTSASDSRASATGVGVVGTLVLTFVIVGLVAMDVPILLQEFKKVVKRFIKVVNMLSNKKAELNEKI